MLKAKYKNYYRNKGNEVNIVLTVKIIFNGAFVMMMMMMMKIFYSIQVTALTPNIIFFITNQISFRS